MQIERRFTTQAAGAYGGIVFTTIQTEVRNPDGTVAFRHDRVQVPRGFSQVAGDVIARNFFRRTGVAARLKPVAEQDVPAFLWRHVPDDAALADLPVEKRYGGETSARQVFDRLAGTWAYWGWKGGYFKTEDDARAYLDEMRHMLARQMGAPNGPQWVNTGLHWAYGIDAPGQGHFHVDHRTGTLTASTSAFERPRPHDCCLQSVSDDLVNAGGIMDLWLREARQLKAGSGTGTNFSALRGQGETLPCGDMSPGLMGFLKVGDRAAGAIAQTGTTRRAAKMVICDIDHPDIEAFLNWKVVEDQKVASLVAGSKLHERELSGLFAAIRAWDGTIGDATDPTVNDALRTAIRSAKRAMIPDTYVNRVLHHARQGLGDIEFPTYDTDWDSEAYASVSGQHSDISVRVTDAFLHAVRDDAPWRLIRRTDGQVARTVMARDLWHRISHAAWASAGPGIQFHDTINAWHTCPEDGPIRASNPSGDYMFLDDTARNPAAINLLAFWHDGRFDADAFVHATRLWTLTLEIGVLMAQFPSPDIAQRSHDFRTLGLGHANLGGLLMTMGVGYDSDQGRAICGALTAIMTGAAYATSARMAAQLGAFTGYARNASHMLRVIRNHRAAAHGLPCEGVNVAPVALDAAQCPDPRLIDLARNVWDQALALGRAHGFRNAQTTAIAPIDTIGQIMDCDTTGIEPDVAQVKSKTLAGGGTVKIINPSVPAALIALGYSPAQIDRIVGHAVGHGSLADCPAIDHAALAAHGFDAARIARIEAALASTFDIRFVFNQWTLGKDFCRGTLGIPAARLADPSFDLLLYLGFTRMQIDAANDHVCGTMTLEGAPHLRADHLPVFDCAQTCGTTGTRSLSVDSHIRMMAAAQGFVSGGIGKTITLQSGASVQDMLAVHALSHSLGIKANALYRDGSKLSQPLTGAVVNDDGDSPRLKPVVLADKIIARAQREKLPQRRKGWT